MDLFPRVPGWWIGVSGAAGPFLLGSGHTSSLEHGFEWKQSLTADPQVFIVVDEFERSLPEIEDRDVSRRADIEGAAVTK